jgi:hypothetical protein
MEVDKNYRTQFNKDFKIDFINKNNEFDQNQKEKFRLILKFSLSNFIHILDEEKLPSDVFLDFFKFI